MEEEISLHEVLVKTSYLTQITEPDNSAFDRPVGYGSGFIIQYDTFKFFVTADHTIHVDDYGSDVEHRTWKDYNIAIFNNYSDPSEPLSTLITPLGGFYYMEEFNLIDIEQLPRPIDVSLCLMKDDKFKYPFLTDSVKFINGEIFDSGQSKFYIQKECFADPTFDKKYFIYGKIKVKIVEGIKMQWENTLKASLAFQSVSGHFLLFNTPEIISNKAEWEGLSGSAVLSEAGECVGVLCDVLEGSRSVWVMPISKVELLLKIAIQQEKII